MTEKEIFYTAVQKQNPDNKIVEVAELLYGVVCPTAHCSKCPYAAYNNYCKDMLRAEILIKNGYGKQ